MSEIQWGFRAEPKGHTPSWIRQVHGPTLLEKREWEQPPEADGIWTLERKVTLHITTADCLPLLLYSTDPKGPIAAIHCGWRGAVQQIARKGVDLLRPKGEKLTAVVGPCLKSCCFEVQMDFVKTLRQQAKDALPFLIRRNGKLFFDLPSYVTRCQLVELEGRIDTRQNTCTYCTGLPSFRRNKGTDPHLIGWIRRE